MSWNYRILQYPDGEDNFFQIHEVYYNDKGEPNSYTANGVTVAGESKESLKWVLEKMEEALDKPILSEKNFPKVFINSGEKNNK